MIDVSQWRASIGLWNYCQAASSRPANGHHSHSFKAAVDSKSGSTTSEEKTSKLPAALSHIAFLLLLFHSLSLLRHVLMIPPTGKQQLQLCTCIFTGILLLGNCYQVQCTTGVTVTDTNYLQSVVLPGGSSSNLIYNDLYLIVCLRMLLLLSGDVELNPGPMIDDRPDISLLTQWLEPLVHWKQFGHCLPGIKYSDILKIEAENVKVDERKLALYSKWLSIAPEATWADVINALSRRRENNLVQGIKRNLKKSAPRSASSYLAITTRPSQKIVMFHTAEDEKNILDTLTDLKKEFPILIMHARSALQIKSENDSRLLANLIIWLETYMHWNDKLTNASLDETFKIIHPFYDFVNCNLIVDMSDVFLQDFKYSDDGKLNIVSELKNYKEKADKLRFLAQVKHLNESLQTIYEGHIPDTSNMPMISMKLHNPWHGSNINGLSLLIHNLLPVGHQQSIMKYITISSGSVIIKYSVHGSTADSLIEYTGGKLQFMCLIGIFSLYINDHPVLQEDENMNFTFELALLEAVTAGNNEAVEFLLQLETVNIDHTNEEGKTALMLACERGHEDIVHSLLSAGANVNIQDNKGRTALTIASEHNHISIIHMLQQAQGSHDIMAASYNGKYEVVKLLISKGFDYKDQQKDGVNAFMLACLKGHTQIVELLLKEQVDPNVQMNSGVNAFMLACKNGHTRIVELLLKEQVDPNVQRKDGWNAFILACENGHTQIVELLLKEQVDPNVQEKDDWNAFMLACQNGHTQIVELLLKEQVDPNVQQKDGWNAFMSACKNGHTQIVELLLKEQVDLNVQRKDGWNAFMLACENGHTQIVELLLKEQVNPNVQMNSGVNAFMLACHNGHTQIVELLLKEQVDHNGQEKDGWNAFMLACLNGHAQIVELLLKEQVDPNVQEKGDWNAFLVACENGHTQIVELLLKEQVDPNVQEKCGWNAFMLACQNGHTQIVELLLKEQVDPNVQEKGGWNALMLACKNGHTQIVELLLKEQVDPNVQKKDGVNALMIASANGHYEVVKLLLKWKADPTIKSNEGHTAISVAKTDKISAWIENYFKKGNIILKEDAASVYSSATVSSGYHTVSSGYSTMRSYPSTLTLDSNVDGYKE